MKISSTCSLKGLVVQNAVQEIAERLGGSLNSSTLLIAHGDAHNTGDTGAVQYTGEADSNIRKCAERRIQYVSNRKDRVLICQQGFYDTGSSHGDAVESSALQGDNFCSGIFGFLSDGILIQNDIIAVDEVQDRFSAYGSRTPDCNLAVAVLAQYVCVNIADIYFAGFA